MEGFFIIYLPYHNKFSFFSPLLEAKESNCSNTVVSPFFAESISLPQFKQ